MMLAHLKLRVKRDFSFKRERLIKPKYDVIVLGNSTSKWPEVETMARKLCLSMADELRMQCFYNEIISCPKIKANLSKNEVIAACFFIGCQKMGNLKSLKHISEVGQVSSSGLFLMVKHLERMMDIESLFNKSDGQKGAKLDGESKRTLLGQEVDEKDAEKSPQIKGDAKEKKMSSKSPVPLVQKISSRISLPSINEFHASFLAEHCTRYGTVSGQRPEVIAAASVFIVCRAFCGDIRAETISLESHVSEDTIRSVGHLLIKSFKRLFPVKKYKYSPEDLYK